LEEEWDEAGLLSSYNSMIYWAQTPDPGNAYELYNEYSWWSAKEYYYQSLITRSEESFARTFRALGQLMHLVSDAALPAHVRNDPHVKKDVFGVTIWNDPDEYETWVNLTS
jgi:hypothetical protein